MPYKSLRDAARDLERTGQLIRVKTEVDPDLEMAEIHRRIFDQGGPAILFERVKGSPFQALSNLYGTFERTEWLFRDTLEKVKRVVELKADPANFAQNPTRYLRAPFTALTALPRKRRFSKPITYGQTTIDKLPLVKSWPMDGGAFVTLPQVATLPPGVRKAMQSNIGMYRIQLSGNEYQLNKEVGMHYQLHRGIGVHHTQYLQSDEPFRASCFIGGPPSHAFAAIMPLPEGLSEMTFAGMLAGRRFGYNFTPQGHLLSTDADFVICGTIRKNVTMPEGPFGDHLGYYSLQHEFPVMEVDAVYHRKDPIWHFSVVGRPPQEDSSFGYLIHKIVKELTPGEFPGVRQINAVDEAGVHPLLLAVGSERYMPFREKVPEEILIQANRLLGSGQTSLAKFLVIAAEEDDPAINAQDEFAFFQHVLRRFDPRRDLHFQTKTTIDTLDYSGSGWNAGSKVIWACRGEVVRELATEVPNMLDFPKGFGDAKLVAPGILAIKGPAFKSEDSYADVRQFCSAIERSDQPLDLGAYPLIILCDDPAFLADDFSNFLWAVFTRANPSHDIDGVGAFVENKHWGCTGPVVIDARVKPWHAPGLVEDPGITKRVDELFVKDDALAQFK